jgi:hypothetical protein
MWIKVFSWDLKIVKGVCLIWKNAVFHVIGKLHSRYCKIQIFWNHSVVSTVIVLCTRQPRKPWHPAGTRVFSSAQLTWTSSGAWLTSYMKGTGSYSPWSKVLGGPELTTHLSLVELCLHISVCLFVACWRRNCTFILQDCVLWLCIKISHVVLFV